jgi:hypothetical protein
MSEKESDMKHQRRLAVFILICWNNFIPTVRFSRSFNFCFWRHPIRGVRVAWSAAKFVDSKRRSEAAALAAKTLNNKESNNVL